MRQWSSGRQALGTWLARKSIGTFAGLVGPPADDHLKVLLHGKDPDLWKSMLVESQFAEAQIVDEVASGFSLLGLADESSPFPVDLKLMEMSEQDLYLSAQWRSKVMMSKTSVPTDSAMAEK
eukprot:6461762-Amphidinium_carterae.1